MEPQRVSSEANVPEPTVSAPEPDTAQAPATGTAIDAKPGATEPKPSYVKLAMRNMVRKRGLSLQHFTLTTIALLAVLVGLSYLTR